MGQGFDLSQSNGNGRGDALPLAVATATREKVLKAASEQQRNCLKYLNREYVEFEFRFTLFCLKTRYVSCPAVN